jgi:hypothetical protein
MMIKLFQRMRQSLGVLSIMLCPNKGSETISGQHLWDKLPVIVASPGDYLTRAGDRVTVHAVLGPSTFSVKGSVWKVFRGRYRPHGFQIWHPNGRLFSLCEKPGDIVSPFVI